jgi:hypothetical protein
MFLGTPHAGSDLSKFALAIGYIINLSVFKSPNLSNVHILKRDSEVLASMQESFSALLSRWTETLGCSRPAIYSFIEEKPVTGLGRVRLTVHIFWLR